MPHSLANQTYKVKRVKFLGRDVPIFCQNLNGPCPLLAIANLLSLTNRLPADNVSAASTSLSTSRLLSVVAEVVLDSNKLGDGSDSNGAEPSGGGHYNDQDRVEFQANLRQNIADCLEVLGRMNVGIDVNVRFHTVFGFEATQEVAAFDVLDIPLVHGWLYDPQDTEAARALGQRSYNELVELLVNAMPQSLSPSTHQSEAGVSGQQASRECDCSEATGPSAPTGPPASADEAGTSTAPRQHEVEPQLDTPTAIDSRADAAAAVAAALAPGDQQEEQKQQQKQQHAAVERLHAAGVIRDFLEANCSQLTVYGLASLHASLRENQLAVFFRNNHFNTLFK